MASINIKNKVIHKDYPLETVPYTPDHLSSKLHQCSFFWSDKCAHCEVGFDELKRKCLSSAEQQTEENLEELEKKTEDCLAKLEGFVLSKKDNLILNEKDFDFLELQSEFKHHLVNNLFFAQDDISLRCESLKEELELLKLNYYMEIDETENEIKEFN